MHLLIRHDPEIADQWSASEVIRRWLAVYTSRLFREGKAILNSAAAEIFQRLGTRAEIWNDRLEKMLTSRQFRGSFFAADPSRVREHSARTGTRRANLSPQPAAIG